MIGRLEGPLVPHLPALGAVPTAPSPGAPVAAPAAVGDVTSISPEAREQATGSLGGLFGGLKNNFGDLGKPKPPSTEAPVALSAAGAVDKAREELNAKLREDVRTSVQSTTGEMLQTRSQENGSVGGALDPRRVDKLSVADQILDDITRERHIELPTPESTHPTQILGRGETLVENHEKIKDPKPAVGAEPEKRSVRQDEMMERILARSTSVAQFRKRDEGGLRSIIGGNLDRRAARES